MNYTYILHFENPLGWFSYAIKRATATHDNSSGVSTFRNYRPQQLSNLEAMRRRPTKPRCYLKIVRAAKDNKPKRSVAFSSSRWRRENSRISPTWNTSIAPRYITNEIALSPRHRRRRRSDIINYPNNSKLKSRRRVNGRVTSQDTVYMKYELTRDLLLLLSGALQDNSTTEITEYIYKAYSSRNIYIYIEYVYYSRKQKKEREFGRKNRFINYPLYHGHHIHINDQANVTRYDKHERQVLSSSPSLFLSRHFAD